MCHSWDKTRHASSSNQSLIQTHSLPNTLNATHQTPGAAYSSTLEQHEIARFHDDASAVHNRPHHDARAPASYYTESVTHTIESILGRPYTVYQQDITGTSFDLGVLSLDNLLADPVVANKLVNFGYMRCTVNYKFVFNSSPMAQGLFMAISAPYEGIIDTDRQIGTEIYRITSYPHAELDLGSGVTTTFSIPYCGLPPMHETSAGTEDNQWSYIRMFMINPLLGTSTSESASLTVYMYLTDLELTTPVAVGDEAAERNVDLSAPSPKKAPIAVMRPKLVKDLKWAIDTADRAANFMGFSKPQSTLPNSPFHNLPAKGYTYADANDDGVVLGLRPTNQVSVDKSLLLDRVDPLSFERFATREQIAQQITWRTTDLPDALILNEQLRETGVFGPTFSFIVRDYLQYTAAGFCFRFKVIKNAFYSGRLAIEWNALNNNATPAFTGANPSLIWDIRTSSDIVVKVPYINKVRFLPTGVAVGRLTLRVVNPLRVNDTYPQTVGINVSVCSLSDLRGFCPVGRDFVYSVGDEQLADDELPPTEQGSLSARAHPLLEIIPRSLDQEGIVGGESCSSFRDLLKRFNLVADINQASFGMDTDWWGTLGDTVTLWSISRFYRFWRGSIRYKIFLNTLPTDASGATPSIIWLNSILRFKGSVPLASPYPISVPLLTDNPQHRQNGLLNPVLEVTVPYYNMEDRRLIGEGLSSRVFPYLTVWADYPASFTTPPVFQVYIAAGDDFSFCYPCGSPLITP